MRELVLDMAYTKIRSDCHGLYVRTNACVYRPQQTPLSYPVQKTTRGKKCFSLCNGDSAFSVGAEVKVHHVTQSPFCSVEVGYIEEYWHCHGTYINPEGGYHKSETVWRPRTD